MKQLTRAVLARLAAAGYSDSWIAARYDVSARTVCRRRIQWAIDTTWPPPPLHGTRHRYVQGCRCRPCVQAESVYATARRQAAQDATSRATWFGEPWTADEDQYLLTGPGTIQARALKLGRTYYATQARLRLLRRDQATD